MSYALLFSIFLMSGYEYKAVIKYYPSEQACIVQAAKMHYQINKIGAPILGTEHRCLPVPGQTDGE